MGLKKRNKINPEFSMSSLTDIIFLLLIFFMLTANYVTYANVDLPEADTTTAAAMETTVTVKKDGTYILDDLSTTSVAKIKLALRKKIASLDNPDYAKIGIAAEKKTPFKFVKQIMQVSKELGKDSLLLTKKTSAEK